MELDLENIGSIFDPKKTHHLIQIFCDFLWMDLLEFLKNIYLVSQKLHLRLHPALF